MGNSSQRTEKVNAAIIKVRVIADTLILRGMCGLGYQITLEEWRKLKREIERKIKLEAAAGE